MRKRFGSWDKGLLLYKQWLETNERGAPWLPALQTKYSEPRLIQAVASANSIQEQLPPAKGVIYGELISFRGLQHAPLNELGVAYLFGMISHELGFLIEAVQPGFPDCHGKRRVKNNLISSQLC